MTRIHSLNPLYNFSQISWQSTSFAFFSFFFFSILLFFYFSLELSPVMKKKKSESGQSVTSSLSYCLSFPSGGVTDGCLGKIGKGKLQ